MAVTLPLTGGDLSRYPKWSNKVETPLKIRSMSEIRADIDRQMLDDVLMPHDPHAPPRGLAYWVTHDF